MATMLSLRAFTVISASFLLLAKADGTPGDVSTDGSTTKYSVTLDHEGACLTEINNARQSAGFNDFIDAKTSEGKRLPAQGDIGSGEYDTWLWKPVCDVLISGEEGTVPESSKTAFPSGTYAFKVVDADTASCTAIVDGWKAAYKNFKGLPPSKSKGQDLYSNKDNVSFVAIYNPSDKATADCQVVTCTKTVTPAAKPVPDAADDETKKEETTKASALICLTTPNILPTDKESAPFTEDQWGQIVTAFEGSASTALPTLLGLAAAVLGVVATV